MKRPYNFYKSIVKDNYELFKDTFPYKLALEKAINTVLDVIELSNIVHPTITFSSNDDIRNLLQSELQYEVNINQGVTTGEHSALTDNSGHKPWYREKVATNAVDFRFWNRYRK